MYLGVAGACAEQEANASTPLSVSITTPGDLAIAVPPGASGGTSNAGEISSTATASEETALTPMHGHYQR